MNEYENEGKLRQFYKRHPLFRKWVEIIQRLLSKASIISWLAIEIIIICIALVIFFSLPSEINTPISIVVGGILTAFVFPAYVENQRVCHDSALQKLGTCAGFHETLTKLLIQILNMQNQHIQRDYARKIADHIADNYHLICIYISQQQIDILHLIKEECEMMYSHKNNEKASIEMLQYTAQEYLNAIRRQGFTPGKADIIDSLSRNSEVQP